MITNNYLKRSHTPYSWIPLAVTYLIVAMVVSSVVIGTHYSSEPFTEIIKGSRFVTDILGLDSGEVTKVSQPKVRSSQSIRFVRLIPVPDHPESEAKLASEVYSSGREDQDGSALPGSYCRVLNESDLMSRLEMGTNYFTIYR